MKVGAADRILAFAAAAASPGRTPDGATRVLAVGWATVELERAVSELAAELDMDAATFAEAPPSAALGARCWIAGSLDRSVGDVMLAVLEPSTEGRIAAALARWDEGPVVAWYATTDRAVVPEAAPAGPFGPERMVGGDPLTGPHRLLVAAGAGTIAP